jgi:hypothetical protein
MSAREEVAGIIDPRAFQSWQGLYDYCLKDGENADFAKRCADAFHGEAINEALAKADIIFARGVAATPGQVFPDLGPDWTPPNPAIAQMFAKRPNEAPEWLWYGEVDGKPVVTFGRWPKGGAQWRYKFAEIQPTEHDHPPVSRPERQT